MEDYLTGKDAMCLRWKSGDWFPFLFPIVGSKKNKLME